MTVNSIYIPDELSCQVDPLLQLGLDRSSLDRLRNIIAEIRASDGDDVAYEVARWLANPITLSQFINTIFLHATNGYVQFRMFVDGQDKKLWGWPWKAAPVSDRGLLLYWAITLASQAALSADKVNFCPTELGELGGKSWRAIKDELPKGIGTAARIAPVIGLVTLAGVIAGPVGSIASVVPAFKPISDALKNAIRDGLKDTLAGKEKDKPNGKKGRKKP
jgi:hypothetical protein